MQKRGKGCDLQQKDAEKSRVVHTPAQAVNQIEQRALVVEDIPVEHTAVHHGLAHGIEDVGVHPVVERVERR